MARRKREDAKVEALRNQRSLNPRPDQVVDDEFASSEFFDPRDLVQVKYEMVRRVTLEGDPVTSTAEAFGFSRPTLYEATRVVQTQGLVGLVPARPGPRRAHKLTDEVVAFTKAQLAADPTLRAQELAAAIHDRFAITVHPRSVERALARTSHRKSGGR